MTLSDAVTDREGDALLTLWAKPRASRTGWGELRPGALTVKLAAPPVDGEANETLVRFLAKFFAIPRRDVELLAGQTGRNKRVVLRGVSPEEAIHKLEAR